MPSEWAIAQEKLMVKNSLSIAEAIDAAYIAGARNAVSRIAAGDSPQKVAEEIERIEKNGK